MKKYLLLLVLFTIGFAMPSHARRNQGYWFMESVVDEYGDTIAMVHILPVYKYNRPIDMRRYQRLVNAVKKVYPIAQKAREEMNRMEDEMCRLPTRADQKKFVREIEKRITAEYTPVLKKMTRFEGRVLVKLIDRETEYTAYQIVKDFRGGFVAGFWQGIAKLFGHNLKSEYDKDGDDRMIEQVIIYYEAGLL